MKTDSQKPLRAIRHGGRPTHEGQWLGRTDANPTDRLRKEKLKKKTFRFGLEISRMTRKKFPTTWRQKSCSHYGVFKEWGQLRNSHHIYGYREHLRELESHMVPFSGLRVESSELLASIDRTRAKKVREKKFPLAGFSPFVSELLRRCRSVGRTVGPTAWLRQRSRLRRSAAIPVDDRGSPESRAEMRASSVDARRSSVGVAAKCRSDGGHGFSRRRRWMKCDGLVTTRGDFEIFVTHLTSS